jgi:hypothetical protein
MRGILYKMLIMFVVSLIQIVGVVIEGIGRVFGKLADYLSWLHDRLITHLENRKLMNKCTSAK